MEKRRRSLKRSGHATRRSVLGLVAAAVTGAIAGSRDARAANASAPPLTKADVGYQSLPRNGEACGTCVFFLQPDKSDAQGYGRCRMVAGRIAGGGWCEVWAPKSKAVAGSD